MASAETSNSMTSVQSALQSRFTNTKNLIKDGGLKFLFAVSIWCIGYFSFSPLWLFCGVCLSLFVGEKIRKRKAVAEITKKSSDDPKQFMETVKQMYQLNGEPVPSWIYYPDIEKAEWLNSIIQQLWPYVANYVKNLVTDDVQTSIQLSSSLLSGFTFTEVAFGDRAPRVTGIKVYGNEHTRRNEIVMNLQIVYDSDCNIGVCVNGLQAGIRDLRVQGLLRVELCPLIERMPLIGAVSAAFIKDPIIDFDLTHLANIFDLPGFDTLLRGAISDGIGAMFVLPEKYIVKLFPHVDISLLRFPLPQGMVRIHVLDAQSLEEKDSKVLGFGGGSDPYVCVKVGYRNKFKTKIVQHSVNPVWNESFDALVTDIQSSNVCFTLYDDDGALRQDFLGCAQVPVRAVFEQGTIDENIALSEATTGTLHVRLEWFDLSSDPSDLALALKMKPSNGIGHSSFLNIYVDNARRLPNVAQDSLSPSPMLKINLPNETALRTKVIPHTNDPVWEENFRILLPDPRKTLITFELKDKQTKFQALRLFDIGRYKISPGTVGKAINKIARNSHVNTIEDSETSVRSLGSFKFSLEQLLHTKDMTISCPFRLKNSGPKSEVNLRMSLRILKLRSATTSDDHASTDISPLLHVPKDKKVHSPKVLSSSPDTRDFQSSSAISMHATTDDTPLKGSPEPSGSPRKEDSHGIGRSPSVVSVLSSPAAVENLRRRLNAKLSNGIGDAVKEETIGAGLGRIRITLRYRQPSLIVLIVKAENLIICDEDKATSDPYVRVHIEPYKNQRKKTKVIKNSLNPVFDQKFEFEIPAKHVSRRKLNVTVKNQTGFLSQDKVLMGRVIIDLAEMDLSQPFTQWYTLMVPDGK